MANQESAPLWQRSRPDASLVLVDRGRYIIVPRGCGVAVLVTLLAIVAAAVLLALTRATWMPALGNFLVYREAPRRADAIVVLGGGDGGRAARGAELYRAGYAPLVITSGCEPIYGLCPEGTPFDDLRRAGVPENTIRVMPAPLSTHDEAVLSLSILQEVEGTRILLVTDTFHSRRARAIFSSVYADAGITVVSVPAERDWFDPDRWWEDQRAKLAVSNEYVRLLWFVLGLDS